jgi:hypothetical protein
MKDRITELEARLEEEELEARLEEEEPQLSISPSSSRLRVEAHRCHEAEVREGTRKDPRGKVGEEQGAEEGAGGEEKRGKDQSEKDLNFDAATAQMDHLAAQMNHLVDALVLSCSYTHTCMHACTHTHTHTHTHIHPYTPC